MLTPKSEGAPWLWVALGCGGLGLIGLCLVPPALLFLGASTEPPDPITVNPVTVEPDRHATAPDAPLDPVAPPGAPAAPSAPAPQGTPAPPPPPRGNLTSTRTVAATVTEVTGLDRVRVGATCTFPVRQEPRRDGTFWCKAEIRCAGELLYGGGRAGYFDCTLYEQPQRHVVGEDRQTTSRDRDAAMRLDTLSEELEVRDDATGRLGPFTLRARVTSVQ